MNTFASLLTGLLDAIITVISKTAFDWDKSSYISLVNLLLLEDDIAVCDAVDHILKEEKGSGIPPIYLASERHPNHLVRSYCKKVLTKHKEYERIRGLTNGYTLDDSVNNLIIEYGNFKE